MEKALVFLEFFIAFCSICLRAFAKLIRRPVWHRKKKKLLFNKNYTSSSCQHYNNIIIIVIYHHYHQQQHLIAWYWLFQTLLSTWTALTNLIFMIRFWDQYCFFSPYMLGSKLRLRYFTKDYELCYKKSTRWEINNPILFCSAYF